MTKINSQPGYILLSLKYSRATSIPYAEIEFTTLIDTWRKEGVLQQS